ncbi:MAG: hypothetical protein ACLGIR_05950 [Actinomycetes bacterium]
MVSLVTYAADVGSVAKGSFAWARVASGEPTSVGEGREALDGLVASLQSDITAGRRVTLGWEAPLFLAVRSDPQALTGARGPFERTRAVTASGGTGSLVTGLLELAHLARRIPVPIVLGDQPVDGALVVWEAFVSGRIEPCPPCEPAVVHGLHGCDAVTVATAAHRWMLGAPTRAWMAAATAAEVDWGDAPLMLDLVAAAGGRVALRDPTDAQVLVIQTAKPSHT